VKISVKSLIQWIKAFWKRIVHRFITQIVKSKFVQNVAMVASGSTISQGLLAVSSIILARLYSPGDFGVLAIYMSVVPILTVLATLQYSMAIVLPKDDKESKVLFGMSIRLSFMISAIVMIVSSLIVVVGSERVGLKEIPPYLLLIFPVAMMINALIEIFNYWNIRKKGFKIIAVADVCAAITTITLSLLFGILKSGWYGLVIGVLLGKTVNMLTQLAYGGRLIVSKESLEISKDKEYSKTTLKHYIEFPKFKLPQELLNSFSNNLPAIMLVAFFGPSVGGFYALTRRVVGLPGSLISVAISRVFYQKSSELHNEGVGLYRTTLKATLILAVVGIIPFGSIMIFGPSLFVLLFGAEWHTAGIYAIWMSLWVYFAFCNPPSITAIPVLKLQKQQLKISGIGLVVRITAIVLGGLLNNPILALALFSVSGTLINLFIITYVLRFAFNVERRSR